MGMTPELQHQRDAARFLGFDDFVVDRRTRELFRGGQPVKIQDQPLKLLEQLLLADGDLVGREEIAEALWPEKEFVDRDAGIHTAMRKLRDALGDSASEPRFVATVPRVGYRMLVDVRTHDQDWRLIGAAASPVRLRPAVLTVVTAAVLLLVVLTSIWVRPALEDSDRGQEVSSSSATEMPEDPDARDDYREALFLLEHPSLTSQQQAIERLERVVDRSPGFNAALGHLAEARAVVAIREGCEECAEKARETIAAALELDSDNVEALRAVGQIELLLEWDARAAEAPIARALALAPDSPKTLLSWASWLASVGRTEEAVESANRAIDLAPEAFTLRADLGFFLLGAGRNREAARACERSAELSPQFTYAYRCALLAYRRLGESGACGRTRASAHRRRRCLERHSRPLRRSLRS